MEPCAEVICAWSAARATTGSRTVVVTAGSREVTAGDGEQYVVCAYHARQGWAASVARWHGESDVRAGAPAVCAPASTPRPSDPFEAKRRRWGSPPLRKTGRES